MNVYFGFRNTIDTMLFKFVTEEDFKIQLSKLEDSLLEELASAKGNILENKELLESLNKTKESSATIEKSLEVSLKLTENLDKVSLCENFLT